MSPASRAGLFVLLVSVALPAAAHGLLARVRVDGNVIVGTAYYSSGDPAGGEWVQVFDRSDGHAKVAEFAAGADGSFRFEGKPGHQYLVEVHGDEGHSIELAIAIEQGARARLADADAEPETASAADLPAWAVIGAILALLSGVALFTRARAPG